MLRAWLRAVLCVGAASLVGCGGDSRDSIIANTNTQISEAASSASTIKSKVEDFVKKKEAEPKDEEGAKKDLDDAIAEAKKLKETAKAMQILNTRALAAPATPEEKKAFLEKHQPRINDTHAELKAKHREMKVELAEANKKFEGALRPLMQALNDAEGEFASISRPK